MLKGIIQRLKLRLNIGASSRAQLSSKSSTLCTPPARSVMGRAYESFVADELLNVIKAGATCATGSVSCRVTSPGFECEKCRAILATLNALDDHLWREHHYVSPRQDAKDAAVVKTRQEAQVATYKPLYGGLPTEDAARKRLKLWTYLMEYFPDAFLAEVEVAVQGNEQHNPGQPLHWAREKSKDQMNTAFRHQFDYARGVKKDVDGQWHLAKAIWRLKAQLQLDIEAERKRDEDA